MKKRFLGTLVIVVLLFCMLGGEVMGWGVSIKGIDYNFNAEGGDWALRVRWSRGNPAVVPADEFQMIRNETTIAEVEYRIQHEKFDDFLIDQELLSNFDPEDPVRQDPPILQPTEEIVTIKNKEYLRTHKAYFKIHIYSLEPLNFLTQFSMYPIPDDWWQ